MGAPANWYVDPENADQWRWWDGERWTDHRHLIERGAPATTVETIESPRTVEPPTPAGSAGAVPDVSAEMSSSGAAGGETAGLGVRLATLLEGRRSGLLGGRKSLEEDNAKLRAELAALGPGEIAALQRQRNELRSEVDRELTTLRTTANRQKAELQRELEALRAELADLEATVVETRELAILQEIGIYQYNHPLDTAVAYQTRRDALRAAIVTTNKSGAAIRATTNWQVNGSTRAGAKMVSDFSKLMLRAYNNEADDALRTLKPATFGRAIERLDKVRGTISRLGRTMSIEVTDHYHGLRVEELRLTADYLAKVAEEKEREREERARLREEEIVRREIEREQARLDKERSHYAAALSALRAGTGDQSKIGELELKLAELTSAMEEVEARAANVRAGYVYVISNVGAFGPGMVKVGMTRRLAPEDRIRELGDASVPFAFDKHALIFSEDAIGLEAAIHQALADRRVNRVNLRREFFYATPADVRAVLQRLQGSALLSYDELPQALEWHQSCNDAAIRGRDVSAETRVAATVQVP